MIKAHLFLGSTNENGNLIYLDLSQDPRLSPESRIYIYTLIFYWTNLVVVPEKLPQFWTWGLEIYNIACQWYKVIPEERIFGSHPHSRLQVQKGASRVGLEALLLTLEHPSLNTSC